MIASLSRSIVLFMDRTARYARPAAGAVALAIFLAILALPAAAQEFSFVIEQAGAAVEPDDYGVITLSRAPFVIKAQLPRAWDDAALYLNSSTWPATYTRVLWGWFDEYPDELAGMGMAEENYGQDSPLYLSDDEGWQVWPFKGVYARRWQRIAAQGDTLSAIRPVAKLVDLFMEADLYPSSAAWPTVLYLSALVVRGSEEYESLAGMAYTLVFK
ncbi:MAG TPA: hypothetical protein DCG47_02770 [Spirochaetaceae bacterium]|nr:hypothetical protein [Spirochaetaceae bacterium]